MLPAFGLPFIEVPSIVSSIAGVAGVGFALWRGKQMKNLIKQVMELVQVYRKAKADGEITPDEVDKIMNELADVAFASVDVWKFTKKK